MKKNILIITLAILGALVLVMPTLAATTVSFSPASINNVVQGQSFNVTISVNPQGINNYAEKIELNYPSDILEVKSFSFGSTWMALTQSGYDLVDNTNGVLVKTAGYPAGFSSATAFGTVSFYAKKAGNGTIKLGSGSIAFEAGNQSALSGTPISFTITAPAVTTPKPTTSTKVAPLSNEEPKTESQDVLTSTTSDNNRSLVASIGGLVSNLSWLTLILGIFIGIIIGVVVGKKFISSIRLYK